MGIVIGVLFGTFFMKVSTYLLERKISKKARESRKNFKYKDKQYDIKADIESQLQEHKKNKKGFFAIKKKLKGGINENGNTIQPRSEERFEANARVTEASPEQVESTPSSRGDSTSSRGTINRNLLEKGRKFN